MTSMTNGSEEIISDVDYLKNLDIQDFLNCDETRDILREEEYKLFETNIKPSLIQLFKYYAKEYTSDVFLYNDPDGEKNGTIFADIVNNFLSDKHDLTIFYENTYLAKKLLM